MNDSVIVPVPESVLDISDHFTSTPSSKKTNPLLETPKSILKRKPETK